MQRGREHPMTTSEIGTREDLAWFSLARQPQEPLAPGGVTLTGRELERWRHRFDPLLRFLRRRQVVLALSGGGMAMACHVSVLRVLELLSIRPERIYGASAGAVIGGLHAAGMSVADLEKAMLEIRSAGELLGFAAKHPTLRLLTGAVRRRLTGASPDQAGIYDLTRVEDYVERTMTKYLGRVPFLGELPMPFSCVSVDIGTGRPTDRPGEIAGKVILSNESNPELSVSDAIGASMSIAGVLTPKKMAGHYHMDGATLEHLPIAVAYGDWLRLPRLRRRPLAILAVDLGYGGEPPAEDQIDDPVDLMVFAGRLQERAITYYNLMRCHRPRHGSSVLLIRPKTFYIELHEVEKIPAAIHAAYVQTVEQLSGPDYLGVTAHALDDARAFLALPGRGA
jgi:predicted acylesterase/phospholipase RssA